MAQYKQAIRWIAENDDTLWLDDERGQLSVTAALVADLFGKTDADVTADLRRECMKQRESRVSFRNQG